MKIHITQQGDTLWKISDRYKITLEDLMEANPQIRDPNTLEPGTKVWVPTGRVSIASLKKKNQFGGKEEGEQEQEGLFPQEKVPFKESSDKTSLSHGMDEQGDFSNPVFPPMPTVSGCRCESLLRNPYYVDPPPHPPTSRIGVPIIPGPIIPPGGPPNPWMPNPFYHPPNYYAPMNPLPYYPYPNPGYYPSPPVRGPIWNYGEGDVESSSTESSSSSWERDEIWESSSSSES